MQTKRTRLLVVGSTYPRYESDHQVPWLRESVRHLAASGFDVTVLAPSFRGLGSHTIDGVPVRRFRYAPAALETLTHDEGAPNKMKKWWFKLLVIPYIISGIIATLLTVMRERIDTVQVHWPFPHGLFALLPKWLLGVRVVSTCHGAELAMARNSGAIRTVLAFCLRHSDSITANSSHTRAEILKLGALDVRVIPYGSTVAETPGLQYNKPLRAPGAPAKLLFCGRLIERKGIHVLLHAMVHLRFLNPSLELNITGEGDCKAEWMKLSEELNLTQTVHFLGFVSNETLGRLYAETDIYVHPAIHDSRGDTEGLGVVLIEALQHQLPVVASAVGGIVDVIVDRETGLLVPEKDPAALAEAIQRLLDHPGQAANLGRRGYSYACDYFDWARCTETLAEELRPPAHDKATSPAQRSLLSPHSSRP